MTRNRSLVEKLKDQRRRRDTGGVRITDITEQVLAEIGEKMPDQRRPRPAQTGTPRVDNFVATMPALVLAPEDFADHNALVRVTVQVREHMIGWAEFARTLEKELNQSVPKEWGQ